MAGLITYSSVLLLARKRLERIERLLRGKVLSGGTVNEIERQVLFLARQALRVLTLNPVPANRFDADTFTPWLATGISQYAVMGSTGAEIARFAARFAPSQAWLYDTLRTGNPDPDRPQVLARSTDLLVKLCERIVAAGTAGSSATELDQMRAYALGYACHVAAAALSAPFIDAVEAELGSSAEVPPREKLSAAAVRGALEEGVSRKVYRRNNPRGGDWNGWLPPDDQVPAALFDALAGAVADAYGPEGRVSGSKAVNDRLGADQPPPLSSRLLQDGYAEYRLLTERGYVWRYPDWLKATLVMFIPPALMLPFAAFLPQGRHLRRGADFFEGKPATEQLDGDRALSELLTFPLAANGAVPFVMTLWLMLGSHLGVGKETIFGIVSASVVLVAAVAFFATLGVDDLPGWVRWGLLFGLPLALEVALIAYVFGRGGRDMRHLQLAVAALSHVAIAVLFVILFVALLHLGVEGVVDKGLGSGAFWLSAIGWFLLVGVLWLVTSAILNSIDSSLPGVKRQPFASDRKHFLRLFDDTALATGPLAPAQATPATLAQRLFPPGRVPLLKLWWTDAAHPLFIRSDRHSLVFAFAADGSGITQTISAPLAPMTAGEFASLLKQTVADSAGAFNGKLKVERVAADEPLDPPLPTGAVFADHGDDQTTIEAYTAAKSAFRPVPAADQDPYVLFLAPRAAAAVRMGQSGSVLATAVNAPLAGPGRLNAVVAGGAAQVVGNANTRFLDTFVPGDVIETTGLAPNDQARVVVSVQDDRHLTLNLAFAAFAAGTAYRRLARNRDGDLSGPGTAATDANTYRVLAGTGTRFERDFMAGDAITVLPGGNPLAAETRRVLAVLSPTSLALDSEFSNAVPLAPAAGAPYTRPGRLSQQGFDYANADPTLLFAGTSVLDRAADLAALLCLGTSSRLLGASARQPVTTGAADGRHGAVREAWQVFRNWNLDHRRANEWRMLVGGAATSEKHGQPDRADLLQPTMPAALRTPAEAGEAVATRLGWVPLFTRWLDMAQRNDSDTTADLQFRDAQASNVELSRGLAFLLDLAEPT